MRSLCHVSRFRTHVPRFRTTFHLSLINFLLKNRNQERSSHCRYCLRGISMKPEGESTTNQPPCQCDGTQPAPQATEEERRGEGPDRRENPVERRVGLDRRQQSRDEAGYDGPERRANERRTGLERRRGPGRRRSDDRKAAEEGEMTIEQFEFCMAIETYKKVNKKMFPTWTEVLEVITQLGYRKVMARDIKLENVPEPKLYGTDAAEGEAA